MSRGPLMVMAFALLAACDQSSKINTNIQYQPVYAQVRLLNLLPEEPDGGMIGAFVNVPGDLPTAWDLSNGDGTTPYTATVIGDTWNVFVTDNQTSIGAFDMTKPVADSFYTFVIAPLQGQPDRGTASISLGLVEDAGKPVPVATATVELVSGVLDLQDADVQIGGTSVPGPFAPGQEITPPLQLPPGNVTLTVTPPSGSALTFDNVPLVAGDVVTLALFGADAASTQLMVVTDTFLQTQSTIGQSTQVIAPSP